MHASCVRGGRVLAADNAILAWPHPCGTHSSFICTMRDALDNDPFDTVHKPATLLIWINKLADQVQICAVQNVRLRKMGCGQLILRSATPLHYRSTACDVSGAPPAMPGGSRRSYSFLTTA